MLSKNSFEKLHTELLLRRVETPVGVMEALIEHTFSYAKYHGFSELSLGEVPFIRTAAKNSDLHSTILEDMGRLFNFAYNFEGLYNFKNKFRPEWKDLYICANNGIKMKHLFFLFVNTNFHNLAIHKLILKVKRLLSYLNIPYNRFFILRKLDFNKT